MAFLAFVITAVTAAIVVRYCLKVADESLEVALTLKDALAHTLIAVHEDHKTSFAEDCTETTCVYIQTFVIPIRDKTGALHGELTKDWKE